MCSPSQQDYGNKVVLITNGTNGTKGSGAGIASAYLAAGAQVYVCGRQQPQHLPESEGRQVRGSSVNQVDSVENVLVAADTGVPTSGS
ncbi:MAG: hypothetical protein QNL70_12245 [Pseudomonas sp.]